MIMPFSSRIRVPKDRNTPAEAAGINTSAKRNTIRVAQLKREV
jgi:hypothetical protein